MYQEFKVLEENKDERADVFLKDRLPLSRHQIQKLFAQGLVCIKAKPIKKNTRLEPGQVLEVTQVKAQEKPKLEPINLNLEVIYEDEDLALIFKPAGLITHPADSVNEITLVHGLLYQFHRLSPGYQANRPGIVHRLDRDTSGVMVIAKTQRAQDYFYQVFKAHRITRIYEALVEGHPKDQLIDKPIGRHPKERHRRAIVEGAREARTKISNLGDYPHYSHVEAELFTGRTHQIRVHLASIHHPVLGDELYGFSKTKLKVKRQMLHAKTLGFIHPVSGKEMIFTHKPPEDFQETLEQIKALS